MADPKGARAILAADPAQLARLEGLVENLGDQIGYGNVMHLASKVWRKKLEGGGVPVGGEFSVGPCSSFMRPCGCPDPVQCDWCCGTNRVTKRVLEARLASVV